MSMVVGLAIRALGLFGVSASPFVVGAIMAAALAAVAAIGGGVLHHKVYQSGYDAALADIAEENQAAIERATKMRRPWKECRARNGQWDSTDGSCTP